MPLVKVENLEIGLTIWSTLMCGLASLNFQNTESLKKFFSH